MRAAVGAKRPVEDQENPMPDKSISQGISGAEPFSSDPQIVAQAIVNLHIARRNLLIYPATHEQVQRSLARAFKSLGRVLVDNPSATMAVMKDTIDVGGLTLPSKKPAFKDLANLLRQYQIATVTFTRGLEETELTRFLQLIATDSEKVKMGGGIEAAAASKLTRIQIRTVDYSHLQLTEEKEILSTAEQEQDVSIWQQFVSQVIAGSSQERDEWDARPASNPEPAELADLLNSRRLDPQQAIDQYEAVITAASRPAQDSQAYLEGIQNFQEMIKELNPDLQRQFLAAFFDRCDQLKTPADAAHLFDGLGAALIVKMLRQANSEGRKISPSLLAFINKVGHLQIPESKLVMLKNKGADAGFLSAESIEKLLAHEAYDTYVDEDYEVMLRHFTLNGRSDKENRIGKTFKQNLADTLDDAHTNSHVGLALTRLMAISDDVQGYRDWARQLSYILEDLLNNRAFPCLIQILTFIREEKKTAEKERAEIAGLLVDRFSDHQFVSKSVAATIGSGNKIRTDALAFLRDLGEPVAVEILEGIISVQSLETDGVLMQLLESLGPVVVQEALERINDSKPEYVRAMIRIVGRLGDDSSAEQIKPLMDHSNSDVCMEALAMLLKRKNKWGLICLREMINQPWSPVVQQAFQLAGCYKVNEVVPNLMAYVQRRGVLRLDLERRAAALKALGAIGDSRAIPVLTKLAHRRWSKIRKHLRYLKEVLFESLDGYPYADILPLLHFGIKQKNGIIHSACEKRLRRAAKYKDTM